MEDVAEVGRLADKYLSTKIIPEKYRADALHIAFATFYEMDVLVSYNLRHIVKLKTRRLANYFYLADVSLARNISSEDLGRVLENIVFLELRKKTEEIFYFNEEKECDFVAKEKNKFFPFQVYFELTEKNKERELGGLVSCCKWSEIKEGVLLTNDQEEEIKINRIKIRMFPAWKWLMAQVSS